MHISKPFFITTTAVVVFVAIGLALWWVLPNTLVDAPSTITEAAKELPQIVQPLPAMPQAFEIPSLGVGAQVEHVGLDEKRNMDVPKNADNVAWYKYGPRPGEVGNAVLAGHYDSETGPAVFYDVEKLTVGDEVIVTSTDEKEYRFRVVRTARYPFNEFPLDEVFGSYDAARLNLITCDGTYDQATRNYSHRVVVYTELVE